MRPFKATRWNRDQTAHSLILSCGGIRANSKLVDKITRHLPLTLRKCRQALSPGILLLHLRKLLAQPPSFSSPAAPAPLALPAVGCTCTTPRVLGAGEAGAGAFGLRPCSPGVRCGPHRTRGGAEPPSAGRDQREASAGGWVLAPPPPRALPAAPAKPGGNAVPGLALLSAEHLSP